MYEVSCLLHLDIKYQEISLISTIYVFSFVNSLCQKDTNNNDEVITNQLFNSNQIIHFSQSSLNISHRYTDSLQVHNIIRACLRSGPKVLLTVLFPVLPPPGGVLPPVRIPPRPAARPALLIPNTELPRPQTALPRSRPPADWVSRARSWNS